ncbi:hypothetical protein WJX72_006248 [[Myrmecia] bisecta]|uniref:Ankyrin repeat domain-containing protein n=1 Tax=[Myrmecia] bisecta TaxID=41462 RepID=A0AAW1QR61_9CHLO
MQESLLATLATMLGKPGSYLTASSTQCSAFGFKFGKNGLGSEDAGVYGSQGRDDYTYDDVEQYFNYMGMLADVGSYDIINELNASGLAPVDILLIMAAGENDTPKVAELLRAGADATVKDPKSGKLPVELATTDAVLELLREPSKVK